MATVVAFIRVVHFETMVQHECLERHLEELLGAFVDICAMAIRDSGGSAVKFINGTWPGIGEGHYAIRPVLLSLAIASTFVAQGLTNSTKLPRSN